MQGKALARVSIRCNVFYLFSEPFDTTIMNGIPENQLPQLPPTILRGIGPALCSRLENHGFPHLRNILLQFYRLDRNFDRFREWLKEVGDSPPGLFPPIRRIGTNRRFARMAFQDLEEYYRGLPD